MNTSYLVDSEIPSNNVTNNESGMRIYRRVVLEYLMNGMRKSACTCSRDLLEYTHTQKLPHESHVS